MTVRELLRAVPDARVTGNADTVVTGLRYDSRAVRAGEMFFAWKGERVDGHAFIADACGRGASAVVLEDARCVQSSGPAFVQVFDARRALAGMASLFHGEPSKALRVVGITGTNGKTTTAFLIKHLLAERGERVGLIGTVQYEIGDRILPRAERTTPEGSDLQELLAQMRDAGCTSVVMEVSSHALAQGRTEDLQVAVGVFTNLTQDHLDFHGTMENYRAAKQQLFTSLARGEKSGVAVLNADDPAFGKIRAAIDPSVRVVTFGVQSHDAQVCAGGIRLHARGTDFVLHLDGKALPVALPLLGKFNVSNALAAAAVAHVCGQSAEQIAQALTRAPQVPGRLQAFQSEAGVTAIVDYAHTEDALRNVLTTLRALSPKRLIVVVGCGGNRDKAKRPAMAHAAVELADFAFFTSDNPRGEAPEAILDDMEQGVGGAKNFRRIADRREAIAQALAQAEAGDIVCIAGKGHESTQEIAGVFYPFDDRQCVLEFFNQGRAA